MRVEQVLIESKCLLVTDDGLVESLHVFENHGQIKRRCRVRRPRDERSNIVRLSFSQAALLMKQPPNVDVGIGMERIARDGFTVQFHGTCGVECFSLDRRKKTFVRITLIQWQWQLNDVCTQSR